MSRSLMDFWSRTACSPTLVGSMTQHKQSERGAVFIIPKYLLVTLLTLHFNHILTLHKNCNNFLKHTPKQAFLLVHPVAEFLTVSLFPRDFPGNIKCTSFTVTLICLSLDWFMQVFYIHHSPNAFKARLRKRWSWFQ